MEAVEDVVEVEVSVENTSEDVENSVVLVVTSTLAMLVVVTTAVDVLAVAGDGVVATAVDLIFSCC